ncbi:MAG: hypothetical protein IT429_11775 [Gemmataceae bacterium]|nr:hypothetical protein [Gemmataceae bacterium]
MKTRILTLVLGGAFAISAFSGVALAASDNHAAPGTPGDKNCVGQTTAYLAQVGTTAGIHGIGGIADASGLTVQEVKDIIRAYCNP